ncbi:ly6/PLAUR domain-containing protein 1 [Pitangus sulphuratus]|nr:ly6/PLAUR domain-containing protein 1 [Pitangus sulphuratus]
MRLFLLAATFWGLCLAPGLALQIQCYQCEEFQLNNDCSSPEFIVNCTVNVQDMCQKENTQREPNDVNMLLSCLLNASKEDQDEIAAVLKHKIKNQEVLDVALQ